MLNRIILTSLLLIIVQFSVAQTILFEEDFNSTLSSSKWCSTSPATVDNAYSCYSGNSWVQSSSGKYIKTIGINIPTGTTELSFDYSYYKYYGFPDISIASSCGGTYTLVKTLEEKSCFSETIDLSLYAGQTIYIQIKTNGNYLFYLDKLVVTNTAGGSGSADYKWADNFNDNNLNLDYSGNDGDEQLSGQSWNIGTASFVSGSATINMNKTEAFPNNDSQAYSIHLDKDESIESPTVDLSSQEEFKISFYVAQTLSSSSTDWWNASVNIEIWDGSQWVIARAIDADHYAGDELMGYSFGYYCLTVYKSTTSPGNYYPNLLVNAALFTSNFKFRIKLVGSYSSIGVNIDNITFRADDNGENLIPCGVSYWNSTEAIHYGRDPGATSSNHSWRGMELEIDDMWNVGTPPDWIGHCNDGNQANGTENTIVWAAISEQEISSSRAKVNFIHSDGTGIENKTMSEDASYSGPGYLYYLTQFSQCNSTNSSFYDTGQGLEYHFLFEYGSDFKPVYYHLNATGIEMGGGQTDLSENNNPEICDEWLPVELIQFEGKQKLKQNILTWTTSSEINNNRFELERSIDGENFEYLGEIKGVGNSNQNKTYKFIDQSPQSGVNYYRLRQIDFDGFSIYSEIIRIENSTDAMLSITQEQNIKINFSEEFTGFLRIYDATGHMIISKELNNCIYTEEEIEQDGLYILQFNSLNNRFSKKIIVQ